MKTMLLRAGMLLGALLAVALGGVTTADASSDSGETIIEVRIWQHVEDAENVWISARPKGGRWDTLGTKPFPLVNHGWPQEVRQFHRFADLAIAGAELRVWQRYIAPELVYVRACASTCPSYEYAPGVLDPEIPEATESSKWTPLGMVPVPLDDGISTSGNYRYGNVTVAVPVGNPGILSDREHLLALRDALAGEASLNWSAGTPTSAWEGVTAEGTPPRVTTLRLPNRGLTGEFWGWLGELTELTELRLEGNGLTGAIPSKLARLKKLRELRLAGNDLQGCVPPPLRTVENHDWGLLDLPDCSAPVWLTEDAVSYYMHLMGEPFPHQTIGEGTYRWRTGRGHTVVFDVAPGLALDVLLKSSAGSDDADYCAPCTGRPDGLVLVPQSDGRWPYRVWRQSTRVTLNIDSGEEQARSYYLEESPLEAAFAERIIASAWTTEAGEEGEWSWE